MNRARMPIAATALAVLGLTLPARAEPACPELARLTRAWVEHSASRPPVEVLERHGALPLKSAAPLLLPVRAVSSWIGVVRRSPLPGEPRDPGCEILGSVAYYVNGPEDAPIDDIVAVVRSGGEPRLRRRLLELRWFDPADGRRHRWLDRRLAAELGAPAGESPLPPAQAVNSLD